MGTLRRRRLWTTLELAQRKALSWTLEVSDVGRMKDSEGSCDTEDTLSDFVREALGSTLKVHSLVKDKVFSHLMKLHVPMPMSCLRNETGSLQKSIAHHATVYYGGHVSLGV